MEWFEFNNLHMNQFFMHHCGPLVSTKTMKLQMNLYFFKKEEIIKYVISSYHFSSHKPVSYNRISIAFGFVSDA